LPVFDHARLWSEVLDPSLDELQAPELDYLVREDPRLEIYRDPERFFERTLVTRQVLEVIRGIAGALRGEGRRVYVLYSFFGGGKTHTLFTIYHAFSNPRALLRALERSARTLKPHDAVVFRKTGERIVRELEGLGRVRVVLVSGKLEKLFPSPARPLVVDGIRVKTLWGYIAAKLGKYSVVAEEDRSVRAPTVDRLARVVEETRGVILVDELLEGVKTYAESGSEADRNYASQLVTFIDNLLSAVARSNVAIVVSIPGEREGDEARLESRYTGLRYAEAIVRAIRRVAAEAVEPVASAEFWRIILHRLFEEVDSSYASKLSVDLRRTYEELQGLFGPGAEKVAGEARYSYPLHPLFSEVLRDIIERNRSLQKTRDAIKLSRIIARKLRLRYEKGELHEDMIMPWHIDPLDGSISTLILKGYDIYKAVVDTDLGRVVDSKFSEDKRNLARIIATSVFLKTYVYDVQASGEATRYYPSKARIALMTYEPSLFQARNWMPIDIETVLGELPKALHYLWSDGERYWFWYIANINEIIEREMWELYRSKGPQLLQELTHSDDYLKGLVARSLDYKRKRLEAKYRGSLFEDIRVSVKVHPGDVEDDGRYRLVVAWEPDETNFEDVVARYFKGGKLVPRQYQNTVVVLAPSDPSLKNRATLEYARIKAADSISLNLNTVLGLGRVDPRIRRAIANIQKSLVNSIKEDSIIRLLESLLNGFNIVYYPTSTGVERRDASQLGITALNLVEKVETVLKEDQKAILDPVSISLEYFFDKLRVAGIDLEEPQTLNEIIYGLRADPSVPMMSDNVVVGVLSRAVSESRLIALDPANKVIFPRIVTVKGGECIEQARILSLKLGKDYKVVKASSRAGIKIVADYLRSLQAEERLPDGKILVREAIVKLDGDRLGLDEFEELAKESPEVMEEATICIREEVRERGITVKALPETVKLIMGGHGEIRIRVDPIGFTGSGKAKVTIEAPTKVKVRLREDTVNIGGETILAIEADEPGVYTIKLRAETPEGLTDSTEIRVQVEGLEKVVSCSEATSLKDHVGTSLTVRGEWKSIDLALEDVVRIAPRSASATIVAKERESGIELRLTRPQAADVALELVKDFSRSVEALLGRDPVVEVTINFGNEGISVVDLARILSMGHPLECNLKAKPLT